MPGYSTDQRGQGRKAIVGRASDAGSGRFDFLLQNALVSLDAFRDLISDAKSGDLAFHGETVKSETVEKWLPQNVPETLREFLSSVLEHMSHRPT